MGDAEQMERNDSNCSHTSGSSVGQKRKLCSLGTGEVVHILHFCAEEGKMLEFERTVQELAHCLYHLEAGISDVRVCHPCCGEAVFVVTFLSKEDLTKFRDGPEKDALQALKHFSKCGTPSFAKSGTLMPDTHTFASLLTFLKQNVTGKCHTAHDVKSVSLEMAKWFPRREEYEKYILWDQNDPTKYTRNLIFSNENMDVLLMCWPPHCKSAIHSHESSSCWVVLVEGEVHEVQYGIPKLDKQFIESEMRNPTGAIGRCTTLKELSDVKLCAAGLTNTYANDDVGLHRVENRGDEPAFTLHVYAPGLRKMKIFQESGQVSVYAVASVPYLSEHGSRTGLWRKDTHPDGILDIEAWNKLQQGMSPALPPADPPSLDLKQ